MSATSPATPLDAAWVEGFVDRYLAGWNAHSVEALTELVTPGVVWDDPALPAPAQGASEFADFLRSCWQAFPDMAFDHGAHVSGVEGNRALFTWHMTGTNTGPIVPPGFAPTGKRVEVHGVDLMTFEDGRIADYHAFYDMQGVVRQLGLVPAPGSRGERALVALQKLGARARRR